MTDDTPAQQGIAYAREARRRRADRRMAEDLRSRGWTVVEPDDSHHRRDVDGLASATADTDGR